MKKKKLTGLQLHKKTISKLQSSQIMGGGTGVTPTDPKYCKTKQFGDKKCGPPNATQANTCTVPTIHLTNCNGQVCLSAGACA